MEEERCSVCGKLPKDDCKFIYKHHLCNRHYLQIKKYGKFLDVENKPVNKKNRFTDKEDSLLRKFDGCNHIDWESIAKILNRPVDSVRMRFFRIGCHSQNKNWTEKEEEILREKYAEANNYELVKMLKHSLPAITSHANRMGLLKNNIGRTNCLRKYNIFEIQQDCAKMYTWDKKYYAFIDIEDIDKIKQYYWYMDSQGYFTRSDYTNGLKKISLHRYLLDYDGKDFIDHINQKRYDNRKINLRRADAKINKANSSINDGILRIQEDLFRGYRNNTLLCEGSYSECKQRVLQDNLYYDMSVMQEQIMYQIPGLFELLSDEDKKKCLEDLQKKYKDVVKI